MPVIHASIIAPIWDQFAALLPPHEDTHPLGCHRPRIPDRVVVDTLVQVLVFECACQRIADAAPATTLRRCWSRRSPRSMILARPRRRGRCRWIAATIPA